MSNIFDYGWVSFGYKTEPEARLNDSRRLAPQDRIFRFLLEPFFPKWLKPNHLTIFRFMGIPVVLAVLALRQYSMTLPLFLFLGITDTLDGSLARVRGQISEWGIVFDSVADKALILTVATLLVTQEANFWLGAALMLVESIVILNAWQLFKKGIIQPANFFGKLKMVCEVAGISLLLLYKWFDLSLFMPVSEGILVIAVFSALISVLWKRNSVS